MWDQLQIDVLKNCKEGEMKRSIEKEREGEKIWDFFFLSLISGHFQALAHNLLATTFRYYRVTILIALINI